MSLPWAIEEEYTDCLVSWRKTYTPGRFHRHAVLPCRRTPDFHGLVPVHMGGSVNINYFVDKKSPRLKTLLISHRCFVRLCLRMAYVVIAGFFNRDASTTRRSEVWGTTHPATGHRAGPCIWTCITRCLNWHVAKTSFSWSSICSFSTRRNSVRNPCYCRYTLLHKCIMHWRIFLKKACWQAGTQLAHTIQYEMLLIKHTFLQLWMALL